MLMATAKAFDAITLHASFPLRTLHQAGGVYLFRALGRLALRLLVFSCLLFIVHGLIIRVTWLLNNLFIKAGALDSNSVSLFNGHFANVTLRQSLFSLFRDKNKIFFWQQLRLYLWRSQSIEHLPSID